VAVIPDAEHRPTLLLDAGTGIRSVTDLLSGGPFRGSILLSHLHWDHIMGLPFCAAADRPDADVDVYLPAQDGLSGRDLLARTMSPPAFPIEPEGLKGRWHFHAIEPGTLDTGGFEVRCAELAHKGGRTYGYRVTDRTGSLAFQPDHSPRRGLSEAARGLVEGGDVLVHDAQFLEPERRIADDFGHATVNDAIELAVRARVRTLVLFHHAPARTDDELDALADTVARAGAPTRVIMARQGQSLQVRPGALTGRRPAG
jgi:ribonuclease BN (tRNA processing enzyme)